MASREKKEDLILEKRISHWSYQVLGQWGGHHGQYALKSVIRARYLAKMLEMIDWPIDQENQKRK